MPNEWDISEVYPIVPPTSPKHTEKALLLSCTTKSIGLLRLLRSFSSMYTAVTPKPARKEWQANVLLLSALWVSPQDRRYSQSTSSRLSPTRKEEQHAVPSRNLGPPENALAAYSLCKCTSRHSPSTSSKTIREMNCQWAHSVRSSSLPIEHPKPPFDHKSLLAWPSVTSCRFSLANITLHNLILIATILHDLVSIVTG